MAILIILTGTAIIVYPLISNHLYELEQEAAVSYYAQKSEDMGQEKKEQELKRARAYNELLAQSNVILSDPFDPDAFKSRTPHAYNELLCFSEDGLMGYLEIPALELELSIYHGTGSGALESGVGHLENTSLPIGGTDIHAVLSAHTGLPGKKLFTDLELLEKGDKFLIHIFDEVFAYEVDQIKVVEPEQIRELAIQKGKNYVTLVTCTPYGVNSHRLLVRGERVPYDAELKKEAAQAEAKKGSQWMNQYFRGMFAGLCVFVVLMAAYWIFRLRRKKHEC